MQVAEGRLRPAPRPPARTARVRARRLGPVLATVFCRLLVAGAWRGPEGGRWRHLPWGPDQAVEDVVEAQLGLPVRIPEDNWLQEVTTRIWRGGGGGGAPARAVPGGWLRGRGGGPGGRRWACSGAQSWWGGVDGSEEAALGRGAGQRRAPYSGSLLCRASTAWAGVGVGINSRPQLPSQSFALFR